jgi:hypothetical protein
MVNYLLGKIYKIQCNVTGLCYVGSTCEKSLARRLALHVSNYKSWLNDAPKYMSSYKILENDDYFIVLLEKFPCDSKDELHMRERFWTNQLDTVNLNKSQGLYNELGHQEYHKQYKTINKEKIQEQDKQYREDNKEILSENGKKYRDYYKDYYSEQHICECGSHFTINHKSRHERSSKHQNYIKTD